MAVASNGPTIAVSLIKHGFLLRATRWPPVEEPSLVISDDQPVFSNTEKITRMTRMALFDAVKLGVGGEWLGGCEKCVCSRRLQRDAAGPLRSCFGEKSGGGGYEMYIRRQGRETVVQHGKRKDKICGGDMSRFSAEESWIREVLLQHDQVLLLVHAASVLLLLLLCRV